MNIITRFKWPVIIAAGLHGALFVSFSPDRTPHPPVDVEATKPLDPIPTEIDLRVPEESDTAGGWRRRGSAAEHTGNPRASGHRQSF